MMLNKVQKYIRDQYDISYRSVSESREGLKGFDY
jgi:hypothetical protein